jgi:hypothetical protein
MSIALQERFEVGIVAVSFEVRIVPEALRRLAQLRMYPA